MASDTEEIDSSKSPRWIGAYRLLEEIGAGGMGEVFLAERRDPLPQRVALKIIRHKSPDPALRARFELEQQTLARMDHPNIARIFDSGTTEDGRQWFAMEHVPGSPLTQYCDDHRLTLESRLELFRQVCDGVQHAHMRGVLHRDLKPSNILVREVDDQPVAKIIDFGLTRPVDPAQLRATLHEELHQIIGTLAYMSPEQAGLTPQDVDTRTDVYSLGVMLYELMVGQLPFPARELEQMGPLQLPIYLRESEPKKPSTRLSELGREIEGLAALRSVGSQQLRSRVRGEIDWVAMKALEKDRRRRYASARDLGRDVARLLRHQPVEAGPPGFVYQLRKWARRHAVGLAFAAVLMIAGAGTAASFWVFAAEASAAESRRELLAYGLLTRALLQQAEEGVWPTETKLAQIAVWEQQAKDVLARRTEVQRYAQELAANGVGGSESSLLRQQRDLVAAAMVGMDELEKVLPRVRRRVELARTVSARTVDAFAPAWQATLAEIKADRRFTKTLQHPIPGLVPLGPNAEGYQEFLQLDSHAGRALPERRADGGFDVRWGVGLVFVLLPGGTFWSGSSSHSEAHNFDPQAEPLWHECQRFVEPFLLSRYEMTQDQWARMLGEDWSDLKTLYEEHVYSNEPTYLRGANNRGWAPYSKPPTRDDVAWSHPAQQVDWQRAVGWLRRWRLTLPTMVQWEYACRAGTNTPWHFDINHAATAANMRSDRQGNSELDKFVWTAPVGTFPPNGFGLHDMHGNVSEYCLDYPNALLVDETIGDPCGFQDAAKRQRTVHRGGSFKSRPGECRSAAYQHIPTRNLDEAVGVRPVFPVEPALWRVR